MSSSKTNTCSFVNILFNGLFGTAFPIVRKKGDTVEWKPVVMQKTGQNTAVIHSDPMSDDPTDPMSTVYTYGPNKPVVYLHQIGDMIFLIPIKDAAMKTDMLEFRMGQKSLMQLLLEVYYRERDPDCIALTQELQQHAKNQRRAAQLLAMASGASES